MAKTIEEVIKDAIRQGMQESSDEHLGNANIHRADLDGLITQAQAILSQGEKKTPIELLASNFTDYIMAESQGKQVAWRQTVHVEENGIKSIKYLYSNEKIMVDDEPLYLVSPSTETLQKENANLKQQLFKMRDDLHKVTSTLEIKAKDLAWWQYQFQSKSGVETNVTAKSFIELNEKLAEAQRCKAELIEYAEILFGGHLVILNFATSVQKADEYAKNAISLAKPKCMEE